jgi:hypothetical protein
MSDLAVVVTADQVGNLYARLRTATDCAIVRSALTSLVKLEKGQRRRTLSGPASCVLNRLGLGLGSRALELGLTNVCHPARASNPVRGLGSGGDHDSER